MNSPLSFSVSRGAEEIARGSASAVSMAFALTRREREQVAKAAEYLAAVPAAVSCNLDCGLIVAKATEEAR